MNAELQEMRRHALEPRTRRNWARSAQAERAWRLENPTTLDGILAWIDSLRELMGEPPTNLDPWRGNDFRL